MSTVLFRAGDHTGFLSGLTCRTEYGLRIVGYLKLTGEPLISRGTLESTTQTVKV